MYTNDGIKIASLIREINFKLTYGIEDEFKKLELTVPQITIIKILSRNGKLKISEISEKTKLANSTVSGIITRLEKSNIINRVPSEKDKRIVYIELSPKGKNLINDCRIIINEYFENIFKDINKEDISIILNGLDKLRNVLE